MANSLQTTKVDDSQESPNVSRRHPETKAIGAGTKSIANGSASGTDPSTNSTGTRISTGGSLDSKSNPAVADSSQMSAQGQSLSAKADRNNRNEICVSPSWDSGAARKKEKRVARRLEAERKEFEKRLKKLEEDQAKQDLGSSKRESRRLTKKQPLRSSTRASSMDSNASRSSITAITSFFSGSRLPSRSRSSSVTAAEPDSCRHQSGDTLTRKPTADPEAQHMHSLPMTLPLRFGEAVSEELNSKNNIILADYTPSSSTQRSIHVTMKSADLRESWKSSQSIDTIHSFEGNKVMPDKRVAINQFDQTEPVGSPRPPLTDETRRRQGDLDRLSFAATLNLERRTRTPRVETQGSSSASSPVTGARHSSALQKTSETCEQSSTKKKSPAGPHNLANKQSVSPNLSDTSNFKVTQSSLMNAGPLRNSLITSQADAGSYTSYTKIKSSPLTVASRTSDQSLTKVGSTKSATLSSSRGFGDMNSMPRLDSSNASSETYTSQRSRISQSLSFDQWQKENRVRKKSPLSSPNTLDNSSLDSQQLFLNNSTRSTNDSLQIPKNLLRNHDIPAATSSPENARAVENTSNARPSHQVMHDPAKSDLTVPVSLTSADSNKSNKSPVPPYQKLTPQISEIAVGQHTLDQPTGMRSRSSSRSSSLNAPQSEDYDTAQESASSATASQENLTLTQHLEARPPMPLFGAAFGHSRHGSSSSVNSIPSSARQGTSSLDTKRLAKDVKYPQQGNLVAKVFVICCHCRFWHDMPSEKYAKLTGIGSLTRHPPESISSQRDKSNFNLPLKKLARPTDHTSQRSSTDSVQCCWCDHQMSKLCCEGWTTITHMRERHH